MQNAFQSAFKSSGSGKRRTISRGGADDLLELAVGSADGAPVRVSMILISLLLFSATGGAAPREPRARDLGVPFSGTPGQWNAITDVAGIEVGYTTLIEGQGKIVVGKGPVRTGVTAILPHGKKNGADAVPAAWFSLNGNGEMTGTTWLTESGLLETPILLTNTNSVGTVHDAMIAWGLLHFPESDFSLGVVAETWDGYLNDISGFHVKADHVFRALDTAASGPIAEGNVGGGTGMVVCEFKGGTGTASRVTKIGQRPVTVGVLVQANFGVREDLRIAGIPIAPEIHDLMPVIKKDPDKDGSIIVVVATDAPLLPHQLQRVVKRAALGLGRDGSVARDSSGDIFIAFSTVSAKKGEGGLQEWWSIPNAEINPIFQAAVEATEEAIINALVAAKTMNGIDDNTVYAIPHNRLRDILKKHALLTAAR